MVCKNLQTTYTNCRCLPCYKGDTSPHNSIADGNTICNYTSVCLDITSTPELVIPHYPPPPPPHSVFIYPTIQNNSDWIHNTGFYIGTPTRQVVDHIEERPWREFFTLGLNCVSDSGYGGYPKVGYIPFGSLIFPIYTHEPYYPATWPVHGYLWNSEYGEIWVHGSPSAFNNGYVINEIMRLEEGDPARVVPAVVHTETIKAWDGNLDIFKKMYMEPDTSATILVEGASTSERVDVYTQDMGGGYGNIGYTAYIDFASLKRKYNENPIIYMQQNNGVRYTPVKIPNNEGEGGGEQLYG